MGETDAPGTGRTVEIVGRDAERERLRAFVDAVRTGPRALFVRGETGIGKTTLWLDAVAECRGRGYDVLVTRPAAEEMRLALVGLVDLFENAGLDTEALEAAGDPLARGRAVLAALRELAAERPAVVAVDDVHWLDEASARALRFALRRLEVEPVGILATARIGDAEDPLTGGAADPDRWESVELGPLSLGALRRVLAGTVDTISRPEMRRIHEVSGGNPLYAIELARGLQAAGRDRASGLAPALPESLQAAIALRLETAPPELEPLLEAVAALGATTVPTLQETLAEGDLDALLALAAAHELLVVDADLGVRFSHPLLASAVYGRTSPFARQTLHARLAERARDPDDRARQLALSRDEPDAAVAAELEAAAARALRRGDSSLAAAYAGHALRLTPQADAGARLRRAFTEIESLAAAGEASRALALADGLVTALPPGPARADALVQRADLEDDDSATAEALLLNALSEAGDERLRSRALDRLARLRRWRIGDVPGAIECATGALALAERVGDELLEARAAAFLGWLEASAGSPRPELMERAIALEESAGGIMLSPGARVLHAKQLLWAGELDRARALHEAASARAVRFGNESQLPQRYYDLAMVECAAGNLAAAEELARLGIEAARDAENTSVERDLLHPLALVQLLRGDAEEARATAARLRDWAAGHGIRPLLARVQSALGLLALSEGRDEEAVAELTAAARLVHEMGFAHPGVFGELPDAVEALARTGDLPAAEELLGRLVRQADAVGSPWPRAAADRARGVLLAAGDRSDDAAEPLVRAEAAFDELGFRIDAARSVLARGRALLRGGHRTLAADALVDARGRFAAAGAVLWEARAAEDLDRAAPGRAAGELTPTERRVAELVAQGLRNREIGQSLLMSVASVEAHLTRIYRKLDIRSRSALARLVADGTVRVRE